MKYKNFKVVCQSTGLYEYTSNICKAKLVYEGMKGKGLKPKIYKNDKL